jgi:hypothetical protein
MLLRLHTKGEEGSLHFGSLAAHEFGAAPIMQQARINQMGPNEIHEARIPSFVSTMISRSPQPKLYQLTIAVTKL